MEVKTTKKYITYFISYLLVYPCSFPLVLIIGFATESPQVPENTINMISYVFSVFVTIVGAIILNLYFKNSLELKKNNKQTWLIFISHIILIPSTYFIYNWVSWNYYNLMN